MAIWRRAAGAALAVVVAGLVPGATASAASPSRYEYVCLSPPTALALGGSGETNNRQAEAVIDWWMPLVLNGSFVPFLPRQHGPGIGSPGTMVTKVSVSLGPQPPARDCRGGYLPVTVTVAAMTIYGTAAAGKRAGVPALLEIATRNDLLMANALTLSLESWGTGIYPVAPADPTAAFVVACTKIVARNYQACVVTTGNLMAHNSAVTNAVLRMETTTLGGRTFRAPALYAGPTWVGMVARNGPVPASFRKDYAAPPA